MGSRRPAWRWTFAGTIAVVAISCASFGSTPDALPEPADAEAGAEADVADVADVVAPSSDGGGPVDANPCVELFRDSFDTETRRWQVLGDAVLDTTIGEAVIVPFAYSQAGAIWTRVDPPAQSVHLSFRYLITDDDGDYADGLTVAWLPPTATPTLGRFGGDLGLCLGEFDAGDAVAVAFVTLTREFAVIDMKSDAGPCPRLKPKPLLAGPVNQVTVELTADAVSAQIESEAGVSTYQALLDRSFPIGWIGFTAATAGARAGHAVDDVAIDVCR